MALPRLTKLAGWKPSSNNIHSPSQTSRQVAQQSLPGTALPVNFSVRPQDRRVAAFLSTVESIIRLGDVLGTDGVALLQISLL
jgi:hypothetical protein